MKLPQRVTLCEVGTRDGFQIEPDWIPTDLKVEVVDRLSATGVPRIEVTSFVSPKAIPALRDAEEVMARIQRRPGIRFSALVPNDKGAVRAVDARVDEIHTVVSASESHNFANVNMSIAESLVKLRATLEVAHRAGVPVYSGISCSFGCPFETEVPLTRLEQVVTALVDMGARGIGLADTTGMANPAQVGRYVPAARAALGDGVELTAHFHNTRGQGLANVFAAYVAGVRSFESSFGELGGCPVPAGATGNVATEDVVSMLHEMGAETGIDLGALLECARDAQRVLGRPLGSHLLTAGPVEWNDELRTGAGASRGRR
jgi:hydroxymethylglutaryl-CoA lyase